MFRVGDFVYFAEVSKYEEIEDKYGYGNIIEIKELPKFLGSDEMNTYAIIKTKYLQDGTPYEWSCNEVIPMELVQDGAMAWKRHIEELKREQERFEDIYNNELKDKYSKEDINNAYNKI